MHREELVRDIIRLVNLPSVSCDDQSGHPFGEGCHQAAQELMALGRQYGFDTEDDEGCCASILLPGTDGRHELGLLGHIDVVPAGEGWRYAPFDAVEKDGWIIGRGTTDNKGPVIMSLFVMRCLSDLGIKLHSTVRLIAGCDEEKNMRDVSHYLRTHQPPAFTLNCDGAWAGCIGEKGILEADLVLNVEDGNLIDLSGGFSSNSVPAEACALLSCADPDALEKARTRCPGLAAEEHPQGVLLRIRGKAAHCCTPSLGDNAIIRLLHLLCDAGLLTGDAQHKISRLCQCFPDSYGTGLRIHHEDYLSGKTTCVPSLLRMENGVLRQTINVRTAVSQRETFLMNSLKKRLAKLGIALENQSWSPSRFDELDTPEIRILLDTCAEYLSPRYKPYVMGGGTHSRIFPRSLPYGPGVMDPLVKNPFGEAHGADEAVRIDDLLHAIRVYVIALKRLDEYYQSNPDAFSGFTGP